MMLTNKAIWIIERNLNRAWTLAEIADTCSVSRYHLAHAFGDATGQSVMPYLRNRRLTVAAEALARGATDILDLALASGYGSHEAFSRAFRAKFGVTPDMVRRTATTEDLHMTTPIEISCETTLQLKPPRFAQGEQILAVGLVQHHPFEKPQNIPAQWQTFMTMYPAIPHKREAIPIGLSGDMDDDGNFEYSCAAEVSKFSRTPHGLIEITLAPQRYAVFSYDGHVSGVGATYSAIWNAWLPGSDERAAEAPCIERHLPSFNPRTGMGGVEIWIPVQPPA